MMTDKTDGIAGTGGTGGTGGNGAGAKDWLPPRIAQGCRYRDPLFQPADRRVDDILRRLGGDLRRRPDRRLWLCRHRRRGGWNDGVESAAGRPHSGCRLRHRRTGALLAAAGFTNVDGADLSPEMREVAARLGVYQRLYHLDMTAEYTPQIAEFGGQYDAVICVGVFGYGPPHIGDLPRIMDAARPSAPVLVTVNGKGWDKMGWDDSLMPVLDAAGVTLATRSRIRHMVKEGVHAELLELRRG